MGVKQFIKSAQGVIRCFFAGVRAGKGVYVGARVHFVNGKNVKLGDSVQIRPGCDLFAGKSISIGARSDIGERNRINGNVLIGDAVFLGPDNYISSDDHCFEDALVPVLDQGCFGSMKNGHGELSIGDGSWIGCHCAIVGDVSIGKHCVVGANSVVTRDVPDFCVVAGVPARVIKYYDVNMCRWVCVA